MTVQELICLMAATIFAASDCTPGVAVDQALSIFQETQQERLNEHWKKMRKLQAEAEQLDEVTNITGEEVNHE